MGDILELENGDLLMVKDITSSGQTSEDKKQASISLTTSPL